MFAKLKTFFQNICTTTVGSFRQLPEIFKQDAPQHDSNWSTRSEDPELLDADRWLHWGPISATVIVIMIGLTTSLVHTDWWPITTPGGCLSFITFLTWNYQVLKYLNASLRHGGGYVRLGWHPNKHERGPQLYYCHRCMGCKVPRSHHCSKCNRCVLLMDHHCPWINNCVGRRNQFLFIRFLFYAIVGCSHAAVVLTSSLYQVVIFVLTATVSEIEAGVKPPKLPVIDSIWIFIMAVLAVGMAYGVIVAVGMLLFCQLRSVYLNTTGIEALQSNNNNVSERNGHVGGERQQSRSRSPSSSSAENNTI